MFCLLFRGSLYIALEALNQFRLLKDNHWREAYRKHNHIHICITENDLYDWERDSKYPSDKNQKQSLRTVALTLKTVSA